MKPLSVINSLYRIFQILFYGQIALVLLSLFFWISIKLFQPIWYNYHYQPSAKRPRLFYDTLRTGVTSQTVGNVAGVRYENDTLVS